MKKRGLALTGLTVAAAILATVLLTAACYVPTQILAAKSQDELLQMAGTEISLQNDPVWRLCALEGIGSKRAQQIVEQRVQ